MIVALQTKRRRLLGSDKGFTLIELLVVLAIIAILAAIVTFGVITFLTNANKSACQQERSTVQAAMDSMLAATNTSGGLTPGTASDWATAPVGSTSQVLFNATDSSKSYLRNQKTTWSFTYTADGKITGTSTTNGVSCPPT